MNTQDKEVAAFLERIGKQLSDSPGASRSGKHRVAFTALRPLIDGALARGYAMKTTWAALREDKRLSMSYQTFRLHCRRGHRRQIGAISAPEEVRPGRAPRRGDIN